ncbi:MAG: phosphatidate cytidylyltransferase [bacterium]
MEKLGVRALVTALFGPLILLSAWQGGYIFLALIASIILLAINEFYDLAYQKVTHPSKYLGFALSLVLCLLLYFGQFQYLWILLAAAFFLIAGLELFRNQVAPVLNIAVTFMGLIYVSLFLGFFILIRELPRQLSLNYRAGGAWIILIFLAIWICDSAAYMLGARFGRHKLFERVSPNKTVEGAVLGFLFALLTAFGYSLFFLKEVPRVHLLVVGVICGSIGQLSDLLESLFKRDAGIKDSSNLLPGHGGILDRFDSEILVAPLVYFYLRFVLF